MDQKHLSIGPKTILVVKLEETEFVSEENKKFKTLTKRINGGDHGMKVSIHWIGYQTRQLLYQGIYYTQH